MRSLHKAQLDWQTRLEPSAKDILVEALGPTGRLPGSLKTAIRAATAKLSAKEQLSAAEVRSLVEEHAAHHELKARQVIDRGTPSLLHGGTGRHLMDVSAAMQPQPTASPSFLARIFGTFSDRELKKLDPAIKAAGALEAELSTLTDSELRAKGLELRQRVGAGAHLDGLRTETMALVREAAWRVLHLRHFDVQLKGGLVLDQGQIAQMKTGEGKTLVATFPAFLNALSGEGVHVITVNDYLAKRDAQWMGPVYHSLGASVGVIQADGGAFVFDPGYENPDPRLGNLRPVSRRDAYLADITYGTNSEFGFDYLRDNMALSVEAVVQRGHHFAIIDEVDNILIDEARTPMIISDPAPGNCEAECRRADAVVRQLSLAATVNGTPMYEAEATAQGDYIVDEKSRSVVLTEAGQAKVERLLGVEFLYADAELALRIHQALTAHALYHKDDQYILRDGEVVIVDENTGRPAPSRRWSGGLHQAIEAKEGLPVRQETETSASITVQNYFRLYKKLSGMTATAETEASELGETYGLDVVALPPNVKPNRTSFPDSIFMTKAAKERAVVEEIRARHELGQPVLLGTISVEESAAYSGKLAELGIPHQVLNARQHEAEATIVAQAGRLGAVTIATDMAGRGTDILLGGNADFLAARLIEEDAVPKRGFDQAALRATIAEVRLKKARGLLLTSDPVLYAKALLVARATVKEEHTRVAELGGLHVLCTTRHESRRIDDQLAGRAGRQGDPGSSHFFLSLEDDLLRVFGGAAFELGKKLWKRLGVQGQEAPIETPWLDKRVRQAQEMLERRDFGIRERLLRFDDIQNKQRQEVYEDRRRVLQQTDLKGVVDYMSTYVLDKLVGELFKDPSKGPEKLYPAFRRAYRELFAVDPALSKEKLAALKPDYVQERLEGQLEQIRAELEERLGAPKTRSLERGIMLTAIDDSWREQLVELERLRESIHLRAFAQKDPLVEYKHEAFGLFTEMQDAMCTETIRTLFALGRGLSVSDQRRRHQPA